MDTLEEMNFLGGRERTAAVGDQPQDIEIQRLELTPIVEAQVDPVIEMVLAELDRLGVTYRKGNVDNVSCNPIQNNPH